jgi:type I restriction enzyme M protein
MSSNQSGEGDIRQSIIDADLVDCMVALPGQLFYNTQIPACLWFLARNKKNGLFRDSPSPIGEAAPTETLRDRTGETLFIDARKMGVLLDRVHRELTVEDIARIAQTYHAWRGEKVAGNYEDIPGFCKSAKLEEIVSHGYVLTPGRYVGAEELEDDDEAFEEKMLHLTKNLEQQFEESARLEAIIKENLRGLGYGG